MEAGVSLSILKSATKRLNQLIWGCSSMTTKTANQNPIQPTNHHSKSFLTTTTNQLQGLTALKVSSLLLTGANSPTLGPIQLKSNSNTNSERSTTHHKTRVHPP